VSGMFDNGDEGRQGPPGPRDPRGGDVVPLGPRPAPRSRALLITAGVLVVGFLALTAIASFWTEKLWFSSIGYSGVFTRLLWTRLGLFAIFGLLMGVVVGLNVWIAWRVRPIFRPASAEQTSLDRYRDAVTPIGRWLLIGVSALMALFAGTSAASHWRTFMLWRHGVPFGQRDPYFHKDIGFYVFDLGWWHYLVGFVLAAAVLSLLASIVVHYLFGGIRLQGTHDRVSGAAAAQLSILLGVFVLAKAADYWLDRYDLLTGSGKLISGMGYTDDHAVLPAKNILFGIAIICALLFFLNVWRRTWLLPSVGLALYVLSAILLGLIWPGIVQQFQVNPTEADKEAPYIATNIDATRAAYDLEDVHESQRSGSVAAADRKLSDLEAKTASVPLVDPKLVQDTFEQQQSILGYYSVESVLDVDRYEINGVDRALVLGAREIDQAGLSEAAKNWSNLHTVYTHGYGMIAAYGNQRPADDKTTRSEGVIWAEKDLPPHGALTDQAGDGYQGRVYFGENSPDYSIVGKAAGGSDVEFDLPRGTSADAGGDTTTYDGKDGVSVGGFWHKLLYAVKFGDPNIILSQRVNPNSKVIYDRDPRQRVEKVAPWLTIDSDPYPAVVDGKILWILDGYTTTDRYPQSERDSFDEMTSDSLDNTSAFRTVPTDEINYMRNAVKATVDAYDGTVTLYAWDETDPMLQAWMAAFPGTVQPKSAISVDLKRHLRYPEDLFKVQRFQFARYHVTHPATWYDNSERWQLPQDPQAAGKLQPPFRLYAQMPGSTGDVFSLTSVYEPYNRPNLVGFLAVDSEATSPDYGKLSVIELTNNSAVKGPSQIANEFRNSQSVVSATLAFTQSGGNPIYGNLLTLPIGDGFMYIQPLYSVRNAPGSYPILKYVLVYYDGRVGIAPTLDASIADALGAPSAPPTEPGGGTTNPPPTGSANQQIRTLLSQAAQKFAEADRYQKEGDTVKWAQALQDAQDLVERAAKLAQQSPGPSGSPSPSPSGEPTAPSAGAS
jgi:uncharacterized membrane protein (UPF0182 family)